MTHRIYLSANPGPGIYLSQLKIGDKINSYPREVNWYDVHIFGIQAYQLLHLYQSWRDNHTATYVGDANGRFDEPHIFEATWPRARYYPLRAYYQPDDYVYQVTRYADLSVGDLSHHLEIFNGVEGHLYDAGALVDFVIQYYFGYPPTEWHTWFDFGKQNTVCSVIARAGEIKWYESLQLPPSSPARRPGGDIHIERTPPALLADHETYVKLGPLRKKR